MPLAHYYQIGGPLDDLLHALEGLYLHFLHIEQGEVEFDVLGEEGIHTVEHYFFGFGVLPELA